MADNIRITNNDVGNVILSDAKFADDTLTDPAAPKTYAEGTILARNTASQKLVPFEPAGAGGNEIPITVLTYEIVEDAGGADIPVRVPQSGNMRREKLVIDAGGTVTQAMVDQLRNVSIIALSVKELNILDNQ